MLSVATPPRARADSFVEFEGFRYRLNVVPDAPYEQYPVSATLVEALSYEDAIMGVKLPDFVYADGVQYPVTGIELNRPLIPVTMASKVSATTNSAARVLIGKALRVLISLRYMSSTVFMAQRASSTDGLPSER